MSDIEIARNAKLKDIREIAKNMGLEEEEIESYGKCKVNISNSNKHNYTWRRENNYVYRSCRWIKKNR